MTGGFNLEKTYLGIPIYLDTNTLLDLLASMEDGFSTASTTITRENESKTSGSSKEGNFGINFYTILKLGLKGPTNEEIVDQNKKETTNARFHTYGSLMNRLIQNLHKKQTIKTVDDAQSWDDINESDFIELQGRFIPNPIVNSLTKLNNLFDLLIRFSEQKLIPPYDNLDNPPIPEDIPIPQGVSKKQFINQVKKDIRKDAENQLKQYKSIKEMLDGITKDLGNEDYQKYVIELKNLPNHRILAYLFNEFIRDRAGAELPYGEFRILGKVVRKLGPNESIDLLEGTTVGLSDEIIDGLKSPLNEMSGQFRIPEIFTSVKFPAIQIIPIAVFV